MLSPNPHYYEIRGRAAEIARVLGSPVGGAEHLFLGMLHDGGWPVIVISGLVDFGQAEAAVLGILNSPGPARAAASVQQRDNSNPCALRRSWADICIRTRQHRLVRVGAYSPGYGDSCAPWARRRFGCPPCLLSTSDAAHRARDLRGPACRLRRVLGPPGPNCCAVVIYLHTVVHRLWLTRQRTALLAITAAPRAEATSPIPCSGMHLTGRLRHRTICSNTVSTALLDSREKGPSYSRGPQFRGAHRLPACCNCLR